MTNVAKIHRREQRIAQRKERRKLLAEQKRWEAEHRAQLQNVLNYIRTFVKMNPEAKQKAYSTDDILTYWGIREEDIPYLTEFLSRRGFSLLHDPYPNYKLLVRWWK